MVGKEEGHHDMGTNCMVSGYQVLLNNNNNIYLKSNIQCT